MDENIDRSKVIDLPFLIETLYFYTELLGNKASQKFGRFIENMQIADLIDNVSYNLESHHPVLRYTVLAVALSCAVPVITFLVFAIASAIITFTAFLLVEGTLLLMGGLSMCVCLLFMIMCATVFVLSLGIFYLLAIKLGNFFINFDSTFSRTFCLE